MLIKEDNKISRKEIANKMNIAESAVQKHIKTLIEEEFIERVGTFRGYWKILEK